MFLAVEANHSNVPRARSKRPLVSTTPYIAGHVRAVVKPRAGLSHLVGHSTAAVKLQHAFASLKVATAWVADETIARVCPSTSISRPASSYSIFFSQSIHNCPPNTNAVETNTEQGGAPLKKAETVDKSVARGAGSVTGGGGGGGGMGGAAPYSAPAPAPMGGGGGGMMVGFFEYKGCVEVL